MRNDKRSAEAARYRRLYKGGRWQALRLAHLMDNPACEFCHARGEFTAAEVVDHIKEHKGSEALFFDPFNLQSLCKACHDSTKQRMEKSGKGLMLFDENGMPTGFME